MLKKIQQDFSYYSHEFKDNYRKGVHRLRTILASRAQAQAFVSNAGGVAVVLGYEPDKPDKNAQELYALLMASPYIDDAVQTFLGSIYEAGAESQDVMYSDSARCLEILHDPVMARAAGAGAVSAGKWIAALAGQSCNSYRDITAVAASATAMNAVAASATAMNAVAANSPAVAAIFRTKTALDIVKNNQSAWATLVACTDGVLTPAVCDLAGIDPTDYADGMTAVAASETAMTAVAASETAMTAVAASETAMTAVAASETAMTAVAASETAMTAVAASETAMTAVAASETAMTAVAASETAMTAVAASETAMTAVAASETAMTAVAASETAMTAVAASETAMTAVAASETAIKAIAASYNGIAAIYSNATALAKWNAKPSAVSAIAGTSSVAIGKAAVKLAGLAPDNFADMAAVAASSTAMAAVAASSTAMAAVAASSTAMAAVAASSTAMAAVAASSTAMAAVAASSTAMAAVAASSTAMAAVAASSTAMAAVAASSTAMAAVAASDTAMKLVTASAMCLAKFIGSAAAKTALIDHNDMLQKYRAAIWTAVTGGTDYFTSQRGQKDEDGVTNASLTNAAYIMFAIPGGYQSGSGVTVCCHGHNGKEAARASGSYSDNNKRYVLLGGGTFTEVDDGMVRTWVYKTK
ncbi:MAG: hypothetical protein ACLVB4_07470 [Butyricicoccus sp.]